MMTPGHLLLLGGSMALWMGLLAAPPRKPSGQPPLFHWGAPGAAPQNQSSENKKAKLACIAAKETEVAQKSPLPQGSQSGGKGEMVAEEPQPSKGGSLPPKAAGPAPPEKLICKEKPRLGRPSMNKTAVAPAGGPGPVEMPQVAPERDLSLGTRPQLGGGLLSGGNVPLQEKPRCVDRPKLASKPAFPGLELFPNSEVTSGGKANTSEKPASNTQHGKPTSGMWKPSPTGTAIPGTGHTTQGKPIPSEKPTGDGKPASAAGHVVHVIPTCGEKPVSNSGPMAHGKPVPGEQPSSHTGHGKHPSGNKPGSPEKPEHGEKPAAEKESKPEKEADDSEKTEGEEEDDLFDDDEEEEEEKDNEEGTSDLSEGNEDGDDGAFDKELDYGLDKSPLNAYSYHDAWSDDDADDTNTHLLEETGALPEAGDASSDRKPIFDAWGDPVGGSRPSLQA